MRKDSQACQILVDLRNIILEAFQFFAFSHSYRWGIAGPEQGKDAAAKLLALKPDLILANSVSATRAAQQATGSVPIVFNEVSEPISLGFVASLAHPGGNITGFTNLEPSIGAKWLELLKEIAPHITRVAVMFNPASLMRGLKHQSGWRVWQVRFGSIATGADKDRGPSVVSSRCTPFSRWRPSAPLTVASV